MTTLPTELVERLRDDYENWSLGGTGPELLRQAADALSTQAATIEAQAAELSSLRAKLAEATEVLEPIAECADEGNEDQPDDTKCEVKAGRSICYFLTLANFRAARRLIEGGGK